MCGPMIEISLDDNCSFITVPWAAMLPSWFHAIFIKTIKLGKLEGNIK